MAIGINNIKEGDTVLVMKNASMDIVVIDSIFTNYKGEKLYSYYALEKQTNVYVEGKYLKYKLIGIINVEE